MIKRKVGGQVKITPDLIDLGAKLRAQNVQWQHCGELLGVNHTSLRGAMRRAGIDAGGPGRLVIATPELIDQARQLKAQGMRWKAIERQLGVSWVTLTSRISKQNRAARDGIQ